MRLAAVMVMGAVGVACTPEAEGGAGTGAFSGVPQGPPSPAEQQLNQLLQQQFPEGSPAGDSSSKVDDSIELATEQGGEEHPGARHPVEPGQTITIGLGFLSPNVEVQEICVGFGAPEDAWCIPADAPSVRALGDGNEGALAVDMVIPDSICDMLSQICHDIRCYEFAKTSSGTFSRSNLNQLAAVCGGCDEPSCQSLLSSCQEPEPEQDVKRAVIGPAGGEVVFDGLGALVIPPGVLSSTIEFALRPVPVTDLPDPGAGLQLMGPGMEVTPHEQLFSAEDGVEIFLFTKIDARHLLLQLDDRADRTWESFEDPFWVDGVSEEVTRLGVFAVAQGESLEACLTVTQAIVDRAQTQCGASGGSLLQWCEEAAAVCPAEITAWTECLETEAQVECRPATSEDERDGAVITGESCFTETSAIELCFFGEMDETPVDIVI